MNEVRALVGALRALPPRSAQVVLAAAAESGWAAQVSATADRYGVNEGAAQALLHRAARAFAAMLDGRAPAPPLSDGEEALALGSGDPADVRGALSRLSAHHAAASSAFAFAEAEAEASPRGRRLNLLRQAAIVVILALAAWFFWQERVRAQTPRFEPRPTLPAR